MSEQNSTIAFATEVGQEWGDSIDYSGERAAGANTKMVDVPTASLATLKV